MVLIKKNSNIEIENKIIVLNNELKGFDIEKSGFSLYISFFGKNILFDLSIDDEVLQNSKKINLSLGDIDFIVLSHGHIDHTSGLAKLSFKPNTKLICHPLAFSKKFFGGQEIGCPVPFEELKNKFHILFSKKPFWILKDRIVFLGQIPREKKFDQNLFPGRLSNGKVDYCLDDSAIVIKMDKGLLIITGCAHSGIENIVKYAREICSEERIFGIVGGLHSINKKRTDELLEFLEKENIKTVDFLHCADDYAVSKFEEKGYKKLNTLDNLYFD